LSRRQQEKVDLFLSFTSFFDLFTRLKHEKEHPCDALFSWCAAIVVRTTEGGRWSGRAAAIGGADCCVSNPKVLPQTARSRRQKPRTQSFSGSQWYKLLTEPPQLGIRFFIVLQENEHRTFL
jgi:hypothetical protein